MLSMDSESVLTTAELGRQMRARALIARYAARRGFAGQANFAHAALFAQWLELTPRPDFWTWIIQTLGGDSHG